MGARDDQHGDGAHDRGVGVAQERPHDRGDRGGAQREPEQPPRCAVGEPLCARGGVLRLGDETLDAGERGVVAGRGDFDAESRVGRDGSGGDGVTRAPGDGSGLAGDHRLVHVGATVDDPAVRGDAAAGADDHDIADPQVGRRHGHDPVAVHAFGLVGQERGEGVQGGGGLREGAHLEPVAEEHDHDQQGEFPPELEFVMQQPEAGTPRCEEGDGDRQPDQQHHAGLSRRAVR